MPKSKLTIWCAVGLVALTAGAAFIVWRTRSHAKLVADSTQAQIMLNPGVTYQTITGWEAVAGIGNRPLSDWTPNILAAMPFVLDKAVNDLGLNRLRLEVVCNAENPIDIWNTGGLPFSGQVVNDHADPNVINAADFHFSYVDFIVDHVLLPMKARVEANGEHLYVNALYNCFRSPAAYAHTDAQEYAEFVLATFQHLQSKYGIVPDSWEMVLEPDNVDGWHSGTMIGKALVATAARLSENGFHPKFIAPSSQATDKAITYFEELNTVPGATALMAGGELSYHRYSNASQVNLQTIAAMGRQYGVNTSMLEFFPADYNILHQDLEFGRVSAWEKFALFDLPPGDAGHILSDPRGTISRWIRAHFGLLIPAGYIATDPANPASTTVLEGPSRWLRQYFRFIRAGAVRIDATANNGSLHPLAFVNANGHYVVVVKADAASNFSIAGLPAGTYGIEFTTHEQYNADVRDDQVVDGTLIAHIPARGVITIYEK